MRFRFHMPHLGDHGRKEKTAAQGTSPKGCVAVVVGREGDQQRRFVGPVACLGHLLFAQLLDAAAAESGFCQKVVLAIPCAVGHFRHVEYIMDRESDSAAGHHLPRLACCFGA
ncbi:Auxin responsive protein [Musa troglodytarum]|uniref:Auxin responsive protein n=1 Tax=Musa troglodytarum TaxID=320322 RepID=A0A9E7G4N4_9LILI|nr:Auxin responsive protein [Musa troglodytarum]